MPPAARRWPAILSVSLATLIAVALAAWPLTKSDHSISDPAPEAPRTYNPNTTR